METSRDQLVSDFPVRSRARGNFIVPPDPAASGSAPSIKRSFADDDKKSIIKHIVVLREKWERELDWLMDGWMRERAHRQAQPLAQEEDEGGQEENQEEDGTMAQE